VSARIAEAVLRDERAVLPVGVYTADYGVTLSLPAIVGREGANRILEPAMSDLGTACAARQRRSTSQDRAAHGGNDTERSYERSVITQGS
jgi:malate/lactate dehydrogenase